MPVAVLAQVLDGLAQADMATAAALNPIENLIHARPLGESAKLSGHELLQGLPAALCAPLKGGVNVVR
jgi:hypothetical protein